MPVWLFASNIKHIISLFLCTYVHIFVIWENAFREWKNQIIPQLYRPIWLTAWFWISAHIYVCHILDRNCIYIIWVAAAYRGEARGPSVDATQRDRCLAKLDLGEFRIWKGGSPASSFGWKLPLLIPGSLARDAPAPCVLPCWCGMVSSQRNTNTCNSMITTLWMFRMTMMIFHSVLIIICRNNSVTLRLKC